MRLWIMQVMAMLAVALVACRAGGQTLLGAGTARTPEQGAEACGWILVRQPSPNNDIEGTDDAQVLLVPPFGVDGGPRTPGAFRLVRALENWPDAACADANVLTVAIPGARGSLAGLPVPPGPVEVLSLWVAYEGSRWVTGPDGALDTSPALPAECRVLAMTSTNAGVVAVVTSDAWPRSEAFKVMLQSLGSWKELPLPDDDAGLMLATTVRLASTPEGAVLIAAGPTLDDTRVWAATITPGKRTYPDDDDDPDAVTLPSPKVTPATVLWSALPCPEVPDGASGLVATGIGDQVVLGWVGGGSVTLVAIRVPGGEDWRTLAPIPGTTDDVVVVPLASEGRVVIAWRDQATPSKPGENTISMKFAEVSAATGRVMAQGDARLAGPATRSDYRAIGMLLAWVSGLVAVIAFRPREDGSLLLPDGLALADPGQRMIAGVIDLVLCVVGAGLILGKGPVEVLSTSATGLLTSTEGQLLIGLTVLLGVTSGTMAECLTGRTIGKVLCGCVVADLSKPVPAGAAFQTVNFGQALIRNMVKWCVPPAGLFGLLSTSARHRGDEFARAGVLSAVNDDEDTLDE